MIFLTICWHYETLQIAIVARVDSLADNLGRQTEFVQVRLTVEKELDYVDV